MNGATAGAGGLLPPPCLLKHPTLNQSLPQYFRKKKTLLRHLAKCSLRHPPGDEIYRSPPPPANDPSYVGGAVTSPPIRWAEAGALGVG